MPEQPPKAVEKLADHINELESLIDGRKTGGPAATSVPILDDLVEPGAGSAEPADAGELESRLLRRVDAELTELSHVIREIIRRCIREELGTARHERPPGGNPADD